MRGRIVVFRAVDYLLRPETEARLAEDQDARPHLPKVEGKCPMVRDMPEPDDAGAPAAAGDAADAGAPAAPAAK